MPVKLQDAESVQRTITNLGVWNGTAIVPFQTLKVMDADGVTLRTVATFTGTLAATISPSPVNKTKVGSVGDSITTNLVTCTPTGGVGPYSYSWVVTAYSSATSPTIGAASNASTTFTQPSVDTEETATFRCTVTDNTGATVQVSVNATFQLIPI